MTTHTAAVHSVPPAARRGIALMLVVITLATATVLTTSFLIAQESAPNIGTAAVEKATAEWCARSSADVIEAAMETSADWITPASAGVLMDGSAFMGGDVTVAVTNMDGGPVSTDDRQVIVTVMANVDGMESVVQRVIAVAPDGTYDDALDPELKEFGLYASDELVVDSSSRIKPWPASPLVRGGDTGKIGLGFDRVAAMSVASDTVNASTKSFLTKNASAGLESSMGSITKSTTTLPLDVWETTVSMRPEAAALPASKFPSVLYYGDATLSPAGYEQLYIESQATLTLGSDKATTDYCFDTLSIREQSGLYIRGDVHVTITDSFQLIEDSMIDFAEGATLTVYFYERVYIEDSVIGTNPKLQAISPRYYTDMTDWTDPRRFRLMQLSSAVTDGITSQVTVTNTALVVGSIHAPHADVYLSNFAGFAGRITAGYMEITGKSMLMMDPVFDNKMGFTERTSPLYDADGDPVAGLSDAIDAVTPTAGFDSAVLSVKLAMPAEEARDNSPDADGSDKRYTDRATSTLYWPVRVHMQETVSHNDLLVIPDDATMVAKLGTTTKLAADQEIVDNGGTVNTVSPTTKTVDTVKTASVDEKVLSSGDDVLSAKK